MIPILYIVATPIGNLKDITFRAVEVLKSVDYILVEDKRQSAKLLSHYQIDVPLKSYHEHSDDKQSDQIVEWLLQGKNLALISDAGTPLISDPGYRLLQKLRPHEVKIVPIPGVSAVVTALSAAGLATDRFSFEGFLPSKESARKSQLLTLKSESRTMVFYEAPHRIKSTLGNMAEIFGADRNICLARELTKTFETIRVLPVDEMLQWVSADENQQRGELVVIVDGSKQEKLAELSEDAMKMAQLLLADLPPKKVSKLVADFFKLNKKQVYDFILSLKS